MAYYWHRWVTEFVLTHPDGTGSFGRKAQRKVVVPSLQAMVNSNQEIRDDESKIVPTLWQCPSYPRTNWRNGSINNDRGLTAFIFSVIQIS